MQEKPEFGNQKLESKSRKNTPMTNLEFGIGTYF